jgi:hypothetical protein
VAWPQLRICDDRAFGRFRSFAFPAALTRLGARALAESSLERVDLPDNIATIGEGFFASCRFLQVVSLGNSIRAAEGWLRKWQRPWNSADLSIIKKIRQKAFL